jgi:hypothetical protein
MALIAGAFVCMCMCDIVYGLEGCMTFLPRKSFRLFWSVRQLMVLGSCASYAQQNYPKFGFIKHGKIMLKKYIREELLIGIHGHSLAIGQNFSSCSCYARLSWDYWESESFKFCPQWLNMTKRVDSQKSI